MKYSYTKQRNTNAMYVIKQSKPNLKIKVSEV